MQAAAIFRVISLLTCLIGSSNLHYNHIKGSYELYHKPTIIYCVSLHVFYLIFAPLAGWEYLSTFADCDHDQVLVSVNNVMVASNTSALFLTLLGTWLKRVEIEKVSSFYLHSLRKYYKDILYWSVNEANLRSTRKLLLIKLFTSFSRVMLQAIFFYAHGMRCYDGMTFTLAYVSSTLFLCYIELVMITVDIYVFVGLLMGNMLLGLLLHELQAIRSEVLLLSKIAQRSNDNCLYAIWRRTLALAVYRLAKGERQLKLLLESLIRAAQVILFSLLVSTFFNFIGLLFRALVFMNDLDEFDNIYVGEFAFFVFVGFGCFANVMVLFYLCECIQQRFRRMNELLFTIWLQLDPGVVCRDELEINLEIYLLSLKQKCCRLHLFGLFNLDMNSAFGMTGATTLHLVLLCQRAIEYWES